MTPGNYNRYSSKDNAGKCKIQFCNLIAKLINDHGVRREHTSKQVTTKIVYIEDCFQKAHDFAFMETGARLRENEPTTFKGAIIKKCPWYFDLLEIFADRASAHSLVTNHDGNNLLEDSSSDLDDVENEDENEYHTTDDNDDDDSTDDDNSDIISVWGTSHHEYGLGSSEKTNNSPAS